MRPFLTVLAIAAVVSVYYVTSAPGAQPVGRAKGEQLAALQKQVRALQTHLQKLQTRTTHLRSEVLWSLGMIETAMRDGDTCLAALTADEFQNTWSQIDRLEGQPIFGLQTAIDDKNACQGLSVARPPLDPSVTPTVAPFGGFIGWLKGG